MYEVDTKLTRERDTLIQVKEVFSGKVLSKRLKGNCLTLEKYYKVVQASDTLKKSLQKGSYEKD